ncbi:MAG: Rne/Rng family ribonuclease [Methylobacterium mesophilicum]|nr:Rne/Rng family ribonuclease [Methylobacterium mesophilicum]
MPNKMLIDASHPEETRVVVTRGNRIEEFDFESQDKKQLRGNIYLARVTRVEPSLQAAFVEYGGNRHGFLAFSEIHPDYYQIPVADRQALLRAEAEEHAFDEDGEDAEERSGRNKRRRRGGGKNRERAEARATDGSEEGSNIVEIEEFSAETVEAEETPAVSEAGEELAPAAEDLTERADQPVEDANSDRVVAETKADARPEPEAAAEDKSEDTSGDEEQPKDGPSSIAMSVDAEVVSEPAPETADEALTGEVEEVTESTSDDEDVESVGAGDALEESRDRRRTPRRHYKIQEVIKRRQILLVQVVKEERGNKGAALTTYLSLAGRYSVLMPNTARGGGISRKITDPQDRKRLKDMVKELEVPQGMGVILRTAGENRTKPEIKRDYEYLMRMWDNVRTLTLKSSAPALVYEEGSLIKRSVRDLYNKEIDEILVSGEEGYREAKDFMRMLMPSHAKVVQPYRDPTPIFARNGIEAQLDRMLLPQVTLKSGGYIIINQTEALVSIDVNSGRSTREHSIEDTALQTNLEAAEEVARQLRLRDLAGLIVIDFIDMEENRNNRAVEKKIKDCLKNDRARIQVGRISHFGLLEMSRQRIRTSVLESTMKPCPHCGGTGHVRSDSSVALLVVRAIEEFLLKDSRNHITVKTSAYTAFYVLNHKRSSLSEFERRFGVTITFEADETVGSQHYAIVRGAVAEKPLQPETETPSLAPALIPEPEVEEEEEEIVAEEADENEDSAAEAQGDSSDRRRKRRRRRRGRDREHGVSTDAASDDAEDKADEAQAEPEVAAANADAELAPVAEEEGDKPEPLAALVEDAAEADGKKRRRGKRGGKRNRRDETAEDENGTAVEAAQTAAEVAATEEQQSEMLSQPQTGETATVAEETAAVPHTSDDAPAAVAEGIEQPTAEAETQAPAAKEEAKPARARSSRRRASVTETPPAEPVLSSSAPAEPAAEDDKPKRGGWWQRRSFF